MGLGLSVAFLATLGVTLLASEPAASRWEGTVHIPGRELKLVVDIAVNGEGKWTGSVIAPGFGLKGTPLSDISVKDSDVSFTVQGGLGNPKLTGHLNGDELSGNYEQAGNKAPFVLQRVGPPQVELPRKSTAVRKEFEGEWSGEMNYLGRKVTVKVKLANQADGRSSGQITLIGRRETVLPVDLITQDGALLSLELFEPGISYDAQFHQQSNEINGQFTLGGTEIPLSLRPSTTAPASSNR
jgi:hypothetical protein